MTKYSPRLTEALEKAEQAAVMAADDATEALKEATKATTREVLREAVDRLETAAFLLRALRLSATCALLALILSAPGCATARSQLVATWEPQPDVHVSYCYQLGALPRMDNHY